MYGLEELSAKLYAARGRKPIVAVANAQAASAAYYIGSSAKQFVVTPSGVIGSIGIVSVHTDTSAADEKIGLKRTIISTPKFKAEGNPHEALTEAARDYEQGLVDDFYGRFVGDVARNRSTTKADVETNFGQGRMVTAKDAVANGMADRIGTLEETVARLAGTSRSRNRLRAERRRQRLDLLKQA